MLEQKLEEEKRKLLSSNEDIKKRFLTQFIFDTNSKMKPGMKSFQAPDGGTYVG